VLTLVDVRAALTRPLPGSSAQMLMATRPRSAPADLPPGSPRRIAAVLILLYPRLGELYFPLTRRSDRLTSHRGQVALPGGGVEPNDETLWETALRESAEEIGSGTSAVSFLGRLTPLYIPHSNFEINPFIGYTEARPALRPNPEEVAEIFDVPLGTLLDESTKHVEDWTWQGRNTIVPLYRYNDQVIWGATAMMLSELEEMLRSSVDARS